MLTKGNVINEMARVLKPGGKVIIVDANQPEFDGAGVCTVDGLPSLGNRTPAYCSYLKSDLEYNLIKVSRGSETRFGCDDRVFVQVQKAIKYLSQLWCPSSRDIDMYFGNDFFHPSLKRTCRASSKMSLHPPAIARHYLSLLVQRIVTS